MVGAPRWIFGLNATYEFPVTDDIQGYVIGDYTWRSAFYSVIDDSAYSKIGNYGLVNLRVGAKFYDQKVDVSFWTKNLEATRPTSRTLEHLLNARRLFRLPRRPADLRRHHPGVDVSLPPAVHPRTPRDRKGAGCWPRGISMNVAIASIAALLLDRRCP